MWMSLFELQTTYEAAIFTHVIVFILVARGRCMYWVI
jgi:hypothetical protein